MHGAVGPFCSDDGAAPFPCFSRPFQCRRNRNAVSTKYIQRFVILFYDVGGENLRRIFKKTGRGRFPGRLFDTFCITFCIQNYLSSWSTLCVD